MAHHPVESRSDEANARAAVSGYWREPAVPKVVVKRDLLPGISVLSAVALLGMAVGWLWSRLAPPEMVVLAESGRTVTVRAQERFHHFVDLALFGLLGLAAGIVTGAAVWMLRERRGPVVMLAAVLGSGLAAWLAMQVGLSWAEAR